MSLNVAAPGDSWLHVAGGIAGSHVVVRNPSGGPVPASVMQRAAELAAWYSKSRGAPRVKVHCCLAKDVSKPRGAPAGLVHIKRYKVLTVTPRAAESTKDEAESGDD